MNKTKIEWVEYSHNIITGCNRNCSYCYGKRIASRFPNVYPTGFKPTFHPERLARTHKQPTTIFLNSMGETFDEEIPAPWTYKTLEFVRDHPQHNFVILTKNAHRLEYHYLKYPNLWIGVSIDYRTYKFRLDYLRKSNAMNRLISFEPLLSSMAIDERDLKNIDWVIIGGKTGDQPFIPPFEWVNQITEVAKSLKIPVFYKDNLKLKNPLRQYPANYKKQENIKLE